MVYRDRVLDNGIARYIDDSLVAVGEGLLEPDFAAGLILQALDDASIVADDAAGRADVAEQAEVHLPQPRLRRHRRISSALEGGAEVALVAHFTVSFSPVRERE